MKIKAVENYELNEAYNITGQYAKAQNIISTTLDSLALGSKHSNDRGQGLLVEVLCNILNYKWNFKLKPSQWCLHHRDRDDTNQSIDNLMLIKNTIHNNLHHDAIVHAMYTFIKNNPQYIDKQIPKINGMFSIDPQTFYNLTPDEELDLVVYYLDVLAKKADRKSPSDCIRLIYFI